jgi:hypothetical protein
MAARTILNVEKPTTQSVKAVCSLLAWKGRASNPLPSFVELGSGESKVVLVLSNKRDAYYVVTARDCSCPSAIYNHGKACKHQRKYFPATLAATKPAASIGEHVAFKPFIEDAGRPAKVSTSPLSVIDCHDSSDRDAAYHSIKMDREMWPMVEA